MGTFNSNLNYSDPLGYRMPGFVDTLTGNFVPYFQVPNITIQEQFAPLLGMDMTFVNQMKAKVSYSRSRQLSLSLIDYQLSESQSTELDLGWGIKYSNVGLAVRVEGAGEWEDAAERAAGEHQFEEGPKRSDATAGYQFPE